MFLILNKFTQFKYTLKDVGTITLSRILAFLFSFLVSILIARLTGPEGRGIYSLVSVSILLLSLILSGGIEEAFPYYISQKYIKPNNLLSLVLPYFFPIVFFILLILFLIPINWKKNILPSLPDLAFPLLFLGTLFRIQGRIIGNSFLGIKNFSLFGYHLFSYSLYAFLITLILNSLRILSTKNVIWVPFLSSLFDGLIFTIIILFLFPLKKEERFIPFKSLLEKYKKILKYGILAQTGVILNFFNLRLDFYIVNYFKGAKELGLYSIATAVGESLHLVPYSIGRIWFPQVSENKMGKKQKTFELLFITFIISFILGVVLAITGKFLLIFIFGKKFEDSYIPLLLLIPGIISLGLSSVTSSYFHGIGKPYLGTIMSITSVLFTIILDFLLIPEYGIKGAAIASSIAYTISFSTGFSMILKTR